MKKLISIILVFLLLFSSTVYSEIGGMTMASTVVSNIGVTTATGQITGLQSPFNSTNYYSAGIATTQCSFGQTYQPGGTLGSVSAGSSGNNYTPNFSLSGLYPGDQQTLYGWARADDGKYYPAGSQTVTTYPDKPTSLQIVLANTSQLTVNWSNVGDRDTIYLDINGGGQVSKSSVATSHTFSGLSSGTSYTIRIWYESNGLTGAKASIVGTTQSASNPPGTPTGVSEHSQDAEGEITVNYSTSGAISCTIRARPVGTSDYSYATVSNPSQGTITGLDGGKDYLVSVKATNSNGSSSYSSEVQIKTKPYAPSIYSFTAAGESITVDFSVPHDWTEVKASVHLQGGSLVAEETVSHPATQVTVDGLSTNTSYYVILRSYSGAIQGFLSGTEDFITTNGRPNDWIWTTFETSINLNITQLYGTKTMAIVDHWEWNNFTNRINEFRSYKNLSMYSFSYVLSGMTITKDIMDEARDAINEMSPPTTVPAISTTIHSFEYDANESVDISIIYAAFNNLKNSLNSIT